jgi:hypothetical protein
MMKQGEDRVARNPEKLSHSLLDNKFRFRSRLLVDAKGTQICGCVRSESKKRETFSEYFGQQPE